MYPVLLSIGPIHLYSFSVFLVLGWAVFSFLFWKLLRAQGVEEEKIFDLTFYSTLVGALAGRSIYVLLHWGTFADNLLKVVAIWVAPGLSLYGGIVGAVMTLIALGRAYKVRVGYLLDALAHALPAALLVSFAGSFLDGAEVGLPVSLPWAIRYIGHTQPRHPIQAYEMLAMGLLLIVMSIISRQGLRRKWPYGLVGVIFFFLFSLVFFGLEFFKESSIYWKSLSANQWILIAICCEALGAFYVRGGGREGVRPLANTVRRKVSDAVGGIYAKFSRKHTD